MKAQDIQYGTIFPSPRSSEQMVKAVCSYGRCTHDDRPDSIHVRGITFSPNEWFIALVPDWDLHVCGTESTCIEKLGLDYNDLLVEAHRNVNNHAQ